MVMACILTVAAGLVVLLISDSLGVAKFVGGAAKMIASTAFIGLAIAGGALHTSYGIAIVVGLCLSWWGDLFLIFREPRIFLAGLISFFLAHVAYSGAFLVHAVALSWTIGAGLALAAIAVPVVLWLWPNLGDMRIPVLGYVAIISTMVALSAGAVGRGGPVLMLAGAVIFYLSDLTVARDRFVKSDAWNRLIGLPLYYGGQVLLAYSVIPIAAEIR